MTQFPFPERIARKQFGQTPIMVPPISVGCAPLGNMVDTFAYAVSEEDAIATVKAALASPIDYIDTAAHCQGRAGAREGRLRRLSATQRRRGAPGRSAMTMRS